MGCPAHLQDPAYRPRQPDKTALYQAVASQLETFLQECRLNGRDLPAHVDGELRRYLDCGFSVQRILRVMSVE